MTPDNRLFNTVVKVNTAGTDDMIVQAAMLEMGTAMDKQSMDLGTAVINLRDQAVRNKLIELGWAPPAKDHV